LTKIKQRIKIPRLLKYRCGKLLRYEISKLQFDTRANEFCKFIKE